MQIKRRIELISHRPKQGQALIEYALILVLVAIAFAVALAATGPAIGNVFSNTVYNLLGQTATPRDVGNADSFWLTVTWVATQTPAEVPQPTRTLPPPSNTPTPGPSPTNTPVTPSNTPAPTSTPGPTNTPIDFHFTAPFYDPVDNTTAVHWRVDKSIFLGGADWFGSYYPCPNLGCSPDVQEFNEQLDPTYKYNINFNWSGSSPLGSSWPTGHPGTQYSVKWTRQIYLAAATKVTFVLSADDGVRLWLDYTPGCSALGVNSGSAGSGATNNKFNGDPSTDCLLISDWEDQGPGNTGSVTRTLPAGNHTLQLDYYNNAGGAQVSLGVSAVGAGNSDDTAVNGSGNPVAGAIDCNWGLSTDPRNANTQQFTWEEYVNGDFAQSVRCYLEFRGGVTVAGSMSNPEMTFWDVWDYQNTSLQDWLEIAPYTPLGDPLRSTAGYWITVNLHQGNTTNYNWTYHSINLADVRGDGNTTTDDNFVGKEITFRYVMQNGANTSLRRWYIDDIRIDQAQYKSFRIGNFWDLNGTGQLNDFITTGRWQLTSANTHGPGMSFEDSPNNTNYDKFNDSGQTNASTRIHYVEFRGFIDLTDAAGAADNEGDTGDPLLTFYQAYSLGKDAWTEVQYTTDPYGVSPNGANWQTVPSGGTIVGNGPGQRANTTMNFVQVPLKFIPATRFRLRFALIVLNNTGVQDNGWWIDDLYLERNGKPRFIDYPYYDDAGDTVGGPLNWLRGGSWDVTNTTGAFDSAQSYTDTPLGNYQVNTNATLQLRYPVDLNNDTPENLTPSLNADNRAGNTGGAATKPFLTFWHWRRIAASDAIYVEYSKDQLTWTKLWGYEYRMATLAGSPTTLTAAQVDWERVEIDLSPVVATYNPTDANKTDDDVYFRFRLQSDAAGVDDGMYIDNIAIENKVSKSFKLWATNDSSAGFGFGNGTSYNDDIDNPFDLWDRWWNGGGWRNITWEQHSGLTAFHDSEVSGGTTQTAAPNDITDPVVVVTHQTFNVLEMQNIIDLRGTDISTGPTMYFWHRYTVGPNDQLLVQVSQEGGTYACASGLAQCYEHELGWGEWTTVWQVSPGSSTTLRTHTWQREQIALDSYAKNGATAGKRVKIRFVSNALQTNNNGDGWYIDDVSIRYRLPPRLIPLPFFDGARSMVNWVAEGKWGLDPEFFRGSGGGPASLGGAWTAYYWNCNVTTVPTGQRCTSSSNAATNSAAFLDNHPGSPPTGSPPPDKTEVALIDINKDIFGGSPVAGWSVVDQFVARFTQQTGVVGTGFLQPGTYTFITSSDDGVRMTYDTVPSTPGFTFTGPGAAAGKCHGWNIICDWAVHAATTDIGTADLAGGSQYLFTVEWFEYSSNAKLVLTVGNNSFSFTDNPKSGPGPAIPDVPAVKYGNSSLMLDGLLNLQGTNAPVLEFYSYWELDASTVARVEVSTDGGFTWTASNLSGGGFSSSTITGKWSCMPTNACGSPSSTDWQRRLLNLASYRGRNIGLRFRLDRLNSGCTDGDGSTCNDTSYPYGPNAYGTGWWVVDIHVVDT